MEVSGQLHACCIRGERALGTREVGPRAGLDAVKKTVVCAPARN
jgi:hypothetical protein